VALILIVSDEGPIREKLLDLFSGEHNCRSGETVEAALSELKAQDFDLVITIVSDKVGGEEILGIVRTYRPRTPVIFICRTSDRPACERLMRKGAFAYLVRPFRAPELVEKAGRAIEYRQRSMGGSRQPAAR
jgi:DNA-binding NtrC family response regulator